MPELSKAFGAVNGTLDSGVTVMRMPAASGQISGKEYVTAKAYVAGTTSPRTKAAGYDFKANLRVAEGTGSTSAYDWLIDWMLARVTGQLSFYNPSNTSGAEVSLCDTMAPESIANWFQYEANNASAKYIDVVVTGGAELEGGVTAGDATLPTFSPVTMDQGVVKVTSGTLITLAQLRKASSTLTRRVGAYHTNAGDYPAGLALGVEDAQVTLVVLNDPSAVGNDSVKLQAVLNTSVACEFYTPDTSTGSHKFTGNFLVKSAGPLHDFNVEQSDQPREMTFVLELDGALTHTVVT